MVFWERESLQRLLKSCFLTNYPLQPCHLRTMKILIGHFFRCLSILLRVSYSPVQTNQVNAINATNASNAFYFFRFSRSFAHLLLLLSKQNKPDRLNYFTSSAFIKLVVPGTPIGTPAVITTFSPFFTNPLLRADVMAI